MLTEIRRRARLSQKKRSEPQSRRALPLVIWVDAVHPVVHAKVMSFRSFFRQVTLALSLAFVSINVNFDRASAAEKDSRPNILFILADDLGYGDLGCYGQQKIKTPNIDKLAANGMRFTDCYAGSTVCAPSRCALMTGLHTGHAFIRGNATLALRPGDLTIAEVLKKAGYKTALIGKWGLGNENTSGTPDKKGFDEYVGYLDQVHAHDYYTDHLWRHDPV